MPKTLKVAKGQPTRPIRTVSRVTKAVAALDVAADEAQSPDKGEGPSTQTVLQSITVEFLERDTMHASWIEVLNPEFEKPYFIKLKKFLEAEIKSQTIFPAIGNIYSWSRLTPLDSVKVVILGQDPYHDIGQAHGLSFSVLPPTKIPPSLRNIYKQIQNDYPSFVPPKSGDLSQLASLGVLWLNSILTVRAHSAASHANKGWEDLTRAVLRCVLARSKERGVVFMAWGLPAQKIVQKVGVDKTRHLVLESPHPSPLSAHRGFLGNGHFRKANEWLEERYGPDAGIDWQILAA